MRCFSALVVIGIALAGNPDAARAQTPDSGYPFDGLFASVSEDAQPAAKPPTPRHTGFQALIRTTGADFAAFPRRRSTYVILGIGLAAAALAHPADDEVNARLAGSRTVGRFFVPGKYIGYAWMQASAAVGTYLIGRYALRSESKTNKVSHLGFDLVRANILTQAFTYGVKYAVRRDRPTGECCSFPSGHASVTFASAAVLERHLGYRNAWPTLLVATYVGTSRIHDNRHFLSDVVFGAALGIATGWTVVGRHGRQDYTLVPVALPGAVGAAFVWAPGAAPRAARAVTSRSNAAVDCASPSSFFACR
jgi:membrane-associated phospholipid phosphatase